MAIQVVKVVFKVECDDRDEAKDQVLECLMDISKENLDRLDDDPYILSVDNEDHI